MISSNNTSAVANSESLAADNGGSEIFNRLVSEWRAARTQLKLAGTVTVRELATLLKINRGTAQRLCRSGKLSNVAPEDIEYFPGPRAWSQILAGVEAILGEDHPNVQTLALAIDHFKQWCDSHGGLSAAFRKAISYEDLAATQRTGPAAHCDRVAAVEVFGRLFGYLIDTRLIIQIMRSSPGSSPALDLATVQAVKGCRGNPGNALPLAFTRASFDSLHRLISSTTPQVSAAFYVLSSMTSKPMPAILSTSNGSRETVFVEPQWTSLTEPLDVGLLQVSPGVLQWTPEQLWLEFWVANVHPCRRLVLERIVNREIDSQCVAGLQVFRSHFMQAHEEPWFDRIPDDTRIHRIGTIADAIAAEPMGGYEAVMNEAMSRLKWDVNDMIVYRAEVENPIPLATYTITFDRK